MSSSISDKVRWGKVIKCFCLWVQKSISGIIKHLHDLRKGNAKANKLVRKDLK